MTASGRTTMYDSTNVANLPHDADAVAGYVGGRWPTYDELLKRFPKARHLSIAVNPSENADCLDVERHDASPTDAPDWVERQHKRGLMRPMLYASVAAMQSVVDALAKAGIVRKEVRLWSAHFYDPVNAHICDSHCGYGLTVRVDGTQYETSTRYDTSLVTPEFWVSP